MELFTPQETAERLRISVRHLHSLCRNQEIEFISLGRKDRRFTKEMIEQYVVSRIVSRPTLQRVDRSASRRLPFTPKGGSGGKTEESGHILRKEIEALCQ